MTSKQEFRGGYTIALFAENRWVADPTQPEGAYQYGIAVDPQGNPAFISMTGTIHYKKDRKWWQLKGCASRIAFGGDGSLYKIDCQKFVWKYNETTKAWD